MALGLVEKKVSPVAFKQLEMPIARYHPEDLVERDGLVVYRRMEQV